MILKIAREKERAVSLMEITQVCDVCRQVVEIVSFF